MKGRMSAKALKPSGKIQPLLEYDLPAGPDTLAKDAAGRLWLARSEFGRRAPGDFQPVDVRGALQFFGAHGGKEIDGNVFFPHLTDALIRALEVERS